jgi:phage terminase small subunit
MENEQHVDLPAVGTGLTQKQEAFAQAFVETGNGTEAHRRAGYGANMSSKTRNEAASRLLANGKVRARVTELQNRGLERHDVTVDRIIKEYAKLAFSDIRMLFDEHGNLKLPYVLPDDIAGAISNLEITTVQKGKGAVEHTAKIKLADKRTALADLGKHFGLFGEDITIKAEIVQKPVSDLELARRLAFMLSKGANQL